MIKINKKGFTLIELLVVIAIIGLLSTLAVVSLNNARAKSRDAKRVADIKQVQTALELYYTASSTYPIQAAAVALGTASYDTISSGSGIGASGTGTTYMGLIPSDPTGTAICANPATAVCQWRYITAASNPQDYYIGFWLEGATGSLSAGANCATSAGIISGTCGL